MKISFHSSTDDTTALHEALVLRQRKNGQTVNPAKQVVSLSVWFAFLIALVWLITEEPPYALFVIFAVFAIYMLFRQKTILRKHLKQHVKRSQGEGVWVPSIVEINEAGLTGISQESVTALWWPEVEEVVREGEYLRVYTRKSGVAQVPLRIFRTPEELQRFETEVNRLWKAHQNDPPLVFPEVSGIVDDEASVPGCVLVNPAQPAPPSGSP